MYLRSWLVAALVVALGSACTFSPEVGPPKNAGADASGSDGALDQTGSGDQLQGTDAGKDTKAPADTLNEQTQTDSQGTETSDTASPSDVAPDTASDVAGLDTLPDTAKDTPCTPVCNFPACGADNGCGELCGCPENYKCDTAGESMICKPDCTLLCTGKECGIAGLGGECTCGHCNDDNSCTIDSCDTLGKCKYVANPSGTCSDSDACTQGDMCSDGICKPGATNVCSCSKDLDCAPKDDGDKCNGVYNCIGNKCVRNNTPVVCVAIINNPCMENVCDPKDGVCHPKPINEGGSCSDGVPCTSGDHCQSGSCIGTAYACTTPGMCETQNGATCMGDGTCTYPVDTTKPCDDGDKCTYQDKCSSTKTCTGTAYSCNGHGDCLGDGACKCTPQFGGKRCETCAIGFETYPACDKCAAGYVGYPNCVPCVMGTGTGSKFTDPGTGLVWVDIPAGCFQMGCSAADSDCTITENPPHPVNVSAFQILETEVTEAQYKAATGQSPSANPKGEYHPVENVTLTMAKDFCQKVGGRLPSEAEWEYAARAGSTKKYPCEAGDACLATIAFYAVNSAGAKQKVSQKTVNAYGLFDMLGNVAEWVSDCWHVGFNGAPSQSLPAWETSCSDANSNVHRGGSYTDTATSLRLSARGKVSNTAKYSFLGIRCARSTCQPQCANRECGSDGCAGTCGACPANNVCSPQGRCTFKDKYGMVWVSIRGGTFQMGCSPGDLDCRADEKPSHQVSLSSFYMLETEVTEVQFKTVLNSSPSCGSSGASSGTAPVECVSWDDAKKFCTQVGGGLPTEAQWEYAARAGTNTKTYFGDDPTNASQNAWYDKNSEQMKHPVAQRVPNGFGLYDMLGNVWEWVNDWYDQSYYNTVGQSVTDPQGPVGPTASGRVTRGGSFMSSTGWGLRSSTRQPQLPVTTGKDIGFRCVTSSTASITPWQL